MSFLFDEIVFGPVFSRRLGISLGINLLPENSKLCNFDCIYCECGFTGKNFSQNSQLPTFQQVKLAIEQRLAEMEMSNEDLDVITFAGNGEPTLHPDFEKIIDETLILRNKYFPKSRVAVLSNATLVHSEKVFNALQKIDDNILKLDSAIEETIIKINKPVGNFNINNLIENLKKFDGNLIIQTLFLKGQIGNEYINNTSEREIAAWLQCLKLLKPKYVMVYTFARETPEHGLQKIPVYELWKIADKVKEIGIEVQVVG